MKESYFITAYGIARKHGFQGSEEEWLNSLTAFYLAQQAGYEGSVEDWIAMLNDPVPAFTIGEVVTLPGGSEATASITGTKEKPVLNLGIPQGIGMDNALALVGGIMQGAIDMNRFPIRNLPEPKEDGDAVPKEYVMPIGGGTMKGAIDMNLFSIRNLPEPKEDGDAVPKEYVMPIAGGTMEGTLNMNGQPLTGLNDPTENNQAANKKYVDDQRKEAETKRIVKTLLSSNWSDSAPYTQSITVEGLTDQVNARAYPEAVEDAAQAAALAEEKAKISDSWRSGNQMTFRCMEEKPALDIPVIVEVYV